MLPLVYASELKQLLNKSKTKEEVYKFRLSGNRELPPIFIEYVENKIIVSGFFEVSDDLIFESGEIYDKEILFDGGIYKNIIFRGGSFKKIFFRRGTYNGYVSIRGGNIENLTLLGGNFNHWLGTIDGIQNIEKEDIKLAEEPLVINRFEIEGGSYANNMWISGGKIDSLEVKCVTPVKIHCKPNDDKSFDASTNKYTTRFNSSPDIRNLIISRYSNKDNFFHFSELELDTIKFEDFTNIGNITISKVKLNDFICFENSDLGKTTFIDCDFSNQTMYFDSSKITEIALAGANLPNPPNINSRSGKKYQKRLALSQIKKVYQNMGDNVTALKYQAEEHANYLSTLNPGWEKINLWLNQQSNRHGQSWQRALGVLLIGSSIFYTAYCLALGFHIDLSINGINKFLRNAAYFLEFLNPIRKSDFLPKALIGISEEYRLPTAAIIIDSLSKLFSAYLIYQFIAAFRKHGKKSE